MADYFSDTVINGGDILLYIEDRILACSTSHTIELSNSVREVACKGSGEFSSAEYGRYSWTVSTDALLDLGKDDNTYISYDDLMALMTSKTIVSIKSTYEEATGEMILSGETIITSISLSAADNENASYSVSLQGRGALTIEEGQKLLPPVLNAPTMTDTTADITFTDPNADPLNETGVQFYYMDLDAGSDYVSAGTAAADATTYQITGLSPTTNYRFKAVALGNGDTSMDSDDSNTVDGTTAATP